MKFMFASILTLVCIAVLTKMLFCLKICWNVFWQSIFGKRGTFLNHRFLYLMALILFLTPLETIATELNIVAWNLEHLDDNEGEGCIGRNNADYAVLAERIENLDADIVAFQEVENLVAAHRTFPASEWHVEISSRPQMKSNSACWDKPDAYLGHLATGFAIRKGVDYRRNEDLKSLGVGQSFQRWGTDITVMSDGKQLRILSVHLMSGCWGPVQDKDDKRKKTCKTLRDQFEQLKSWVDDRQDEGIAFLIAGDFNRNLAVPKDWGWSIMSTVAEPIKLLTADIPYRCIPRYTDFIDHLVVGGGADAMYVSGSFREWPLQGPHPDHCAISALFQLGQ